MSVDAHKNIARRFLRSFETGAEIRLFYQPDYMHHNDAFYPDLAPRIEGFIEGLRNEGGGLHDIVQLPFHR